MNNKKRQNEILKWITERKSEKGENRDEMLISGGLPTRIYEVGDVSLALIKSLSLAGQVCEVDGTSPTLLLNSEF